MKRIANVLPLIATTHLALKPAPPPDAETTCGPLRDGRDDLLVWATRDPHTGLTYFLGRFDRLGRPRGEPLHLGWGYDGELVCVAAIARDRRVAVVFPFVDPYGGTPALTIAIVERGRVVAKHDFVRVLCWDLKPVAIAPAGRDWLVDYRCGEDGPIERVTVDRDGHRR